VEREADYSRPSTNDVKNSSSYPFVSVVRSLMAHAHNFIFVKNGVNDRERDELK